MADEKGKIQTRVLNIVGTFPFFSGDQGLSDSQAGQAIDQAVEVYSKTFPHTIIVDVAGDAGKYYDLNTILTSWENDFSIIKSIDWDVATRVGSDELPNFLSEDDGDWQFYRDAALRYLFFPKLAPTSSTQFRVEYTVRHTLDEAQTTVPIHHELAIVYLSVAEFARMAQIRVEKSLDPPAGAEFVTMRDKGRGFANVAIAYWNKYIKEIGGSDGVPAASATREFDQRYMIGDDYIYHSGRLR